jgi:hypothetical protein
MKPRHVPAISIALILLSTLLALSLHAQTPQAKPGPEQERLKVWVGNWTYQGIAHATPTGKAGTFSGTQKTRMILGGHFLESRWKDKGEIGDGKTILTEGVEITAYNPSKQAYSVFAFESDGYRSEATLTVDGNTWTQLTPRSGPEGKAYQGRAVTTFSPDGKQATVKVDISLDGQVWIPRYDFVLRRK